MQDYLAEYAKNGTSKCRECKKYIVRETFRICIRKKSKFADVLEKHWYHIECFFREHSNNIEIEEIEGFVKLKPEDQQLIRLKVKKHNRKRCRSKAIPESEQASCSHTDNKENISQVIPDATPIKQLKENTEEKQTTIDNQNHLFQNYKTNLNNVSTSDLKRLLKENGQETPVRRDECLNRLADAMAFGVLERCPKCKKGQLVLDDRGYKCSAKLEYGPCIYTTLNPERFAIKIPTEYQDLEPFCNFKPKIETRLFHFNPIDDKAKIKDKDDLSFADLAIKSWYETVIVQGGTAVHPSSGLEDTAIVYKDDENTIYSVHLTKIDTLLDKNSFYVLQILMDPVKEKYWLFRTWGRTGTERGDILLKRKDLQEAIQLFKKLYLEKTKNNWLSRSNFVKHPGSYYQLEIDYSKNHHVNKILEMDESSNIPKNVQRLIQRIFDTEIMKSTIIEYDLDINKMPLGLLSKEQIAKAKNVVLTLDVLIEKPDENRGEIVEASHKFYSFVPHVGNKAKVMLDNQNIVNNKLEMLHDLNEIVTAYEMFKPCSSDTEIKLIEILYSKLNTQIIPVDKTSPEFEMIKIYAHNTHSPLHSDYKLEVQEVFKIFRQGEEERFQPFEKCEDRRLLWHGSRMTNFAGLLSRGLRISPPEVLKKNGNMFGKGVYFADMVTKSANYCHPCPSNNIGLLLLCEVALGEMESFTSAAKNIISDGNFSSWGVGRLQPDPKQNFILPNGTVVPLGSIVKTGIKTVLRHNEFIVYDEAKIKVKYLVQIKFHYQK